MTTTHTNIAIVEGEVYILDWKELPIDGSLNAGSIIKFCGNYVYVLKPHILQFVLASTRCLSGIPQLDRKHFVKPKVDVEELANDNADIDGYSIGSTAISDYIIGFKACYNTKEAEFTEQDVITAIGFGINMVKYAY